MDHRAVDQAERINSSKSPVLEYCGGAVSPEMEPPKLLWVKENLQESWSMVFRWMDLSDWLSYSLCTTVCKWTYLGHAHMQHVNDNNSRDMEACGWDDDFWEEIGLGDLIEGHHAKIVNHNDRTKCCFPWPSSGFTDKANIQCLVGKVNTPFLHLQGLVQELGLVPGIAVGTSLIDAHAGGVGVIESVLPSETEAAVFLAKRISVSLEHDKEAICNRMVLVCGTSTCHMAVSQKKLFIPGVWGPFWSAMVPEYWLTEGGQSATGALLDHIIESHGASTVLANRAASQDISVFELLNKMLETMRVEQNLSFVAALTEDVHVLPDFHGNRYLVTNNSFPTYPKAKGVIYGLTLDTSEKQLALLYLAAVQGIAYGTRHIVEHCNANGHKVIACILGWNVLNFHFVFTLLESNCKINTLLACGGLSKNSIFMQEHADIIAVSWALSLESCTRRNRGRVEEITKMAGTKKKKESAAILGAVATRKYHNLREAMKAMNAPGEKYRDQWMSLDVKFQLPVVDDQMFYSFLAVIHPSKDPKVKKYHDAKYKIFRGLYEQQLSYRSMIAEALS
ncbi:hypothetical protein V8G54_015282 [Vigna mungo]|uniref:Carbohydrate kinase FGGY C-terminal domain-containing protein n=1 Tax=Vigna mungo TaxID=3915 RepID=A0AAQ3NJY4_VIGMU